MSKIKVEHLELKPLLKEEKYSSGFSKIEKGDLFIVNTDKDTFKGEVVYKYSTQIVVELNGKKYNVTNNSLEGDKLRTHEIVDGKTQPATITTGVKSIVIMRGGATITTLLPDNAQFGGEGKPKERPKKEEPKKPAVRPFYEKAFNECSSTLNSVQEDDKLIIRVGKLISHTEIGADTRTQIEMHIRKIYKDDLIKAVITKVMGKDASKYDDIKDGFLKISMSQSLEVNDNGVTLLVKQMSKDGIPFTIEGIYDMEIDKFFEIDDPTFDELASSENFRNIMQQDPSFIEQLFGAQPKGLLPIQAKLQKLGLHKAYYTKGKKVKFKYSGKPLRQGNRLSLVPGKTYEARFSKDRVIRLVGDRRGESILLKIIEELDQQICLVDISFDKLTNGNLESFPLGKGAIQIVDINYS